jgi:hypothetical protein
MPVKFCSSVAAFFALAFVLTGCGSGSSTGAGSGSSGTATASLSATSMTFSVAPGQTSSAQSVTLSNTGTAPLTLTSVTVTGTNPTDFAFSSTSSCALSGTATLAAGASCTVAITFTPPSAATYTATITVTDNSGGATGATQTVTLSGTGAAPLAALSPTTLTFPATVAGTTSSALTGTLTNSGTSALTLTGIALGGTNPTAFAQTSNCGSTLAAGAFCTLSVTFTPATAGATYAATLTVTDNAASSPQTLSLSGAAAAPLATLSTSSLTFPTTAIGVTSSPLTATITNGGGAPLSISSIVLGGTNPTDFAATNNCGSTLAPGALCTLSVTFTPASGSTYGATITITDSAAGSPQTLTLSGAGSGPQATLSSSSITFPSTAVGSTAAVMSVTLTNTGNATLNIAGIVLGGTNSAQFTESSTCGATLTSGSQCSISATFTPASAVTYGATITLTDDARSSPQTITLSGAGTSSSISYQLYAFPETDNSVTPLYNLINGAQSKIDMTMYALEDTTFTNDLVALCKKSVVVRVILDQNDEKSGNTTAYNALNAQANCSAVWANKAFEATHQKSFIVDGKQVAIMSLNLQSQYYSTTRDFAMIENDPVDIAAIQATFNADYAAGTPSSGVAGTSDFSYIPATGTDLIWSPTTAQAAMTNIIANAKSTLLIENEEMASSASYIISALETACKNGVQVHIAIVDQSSYESNFTALEAAGCHVHTIPDTTNGFYIHAKAVVADYGLSTQSVYMGSINYSNASMDDNRELGMYITDTPSISLLYTTMTSDYNNATEW